jgi:hypothetical protein
MVKIVSFGSNCEVSMMINRYYNNSLYSQLFNWTNITLNNLIIFLNNKDKFNNFNNIFIVYKIFENNNIIYITNSIEDIKKFDNGTNYEVHIDYEFYLDNKKIFWSHGVVKYINEILNSNSDNYKNEILSKYNYLLNKLFDIFNNDSEIPTKIYLKLLKIIKK